MYSHYHRWKLQLGAFLIFFNTILLKLSFMIVIYCLIVGLHMLSYQDDEGVPEEI